MSEQTPTDSQLIQAHLGGHPAALAALWVRYDRFAFGLAHAILEDRHAAEDVRQDVFLMARSQLGQLQDPGRLGAWLATITRNACRSWLRRKRPDVPLDAAGDQPDPQALASAELERREQRTLLRQMIDGLPEKQRVVIELHYFEGYRVARIAHFLGVSEATVKWRIHEARAVLQQDARTRGYTETRR
jgi:RNA polymerase sigma-70 factor, ECF subfamily